MTESPFHLLGDQSPLLEAPKSRMAALGSVLVHALVAMLIVVVPWTPSFTTNRTGPRITLDLSQATPLIAPPSPLTQKLDNQVKPAEQVNLQSLLSRPTQTSPPPRTSGMTQPAAPKQFEAPPVAAPPSPKPEIEAPKLDIGRQQAGEMVARSLPGVGEINATPLPVQPPPQIQPEEKPKISFEKPGGLLGPVGNSGNAQGRVPLPQRSATVEDAMRQVARGGGGGVSVGDLGEGSGGLGDSLNNPASATKNASALELLSDTQGVDFKPYLIRILSSVRRNWFAVMPESARLGRSGKVLIQFAINKDGSVPKLVIASTSGADALDRAAVAGISASNPFPPLPAEFRGGQVRLQFTFRYNAPR